MDDRYKYKSIVQLRDMVEDLRKEGEKNPDVDGELREVEEALREKIEEARRPKKKPSCLLSRFEYSQDIVEEF